MALRRGGAALTIANGVREFAVVSPSVTAVRDGDRELTYAALGERSSRLACALLDGGLHPGDPVAVLLGNRLEYPEVAAGLAKAGLVAVPLNPRLTPPEAAYVLEHSRARGLVLDDALAEVVAESVTSLDPRTVLSMDGTTVGTDYEQALAAARPVDPRVEVDELDPFAIAYTSGTTGRPKGVLLSHRARALAFYGTALEWGLGPGRRTVAIAPMYHGAGFCFAYAAVHTGGTLSMLRAFDPERALDLFERDRIQSAFLVPTHAQMVRALAPGGLGDRDLGALETLYFNAAALPWPLKEWVLETFPGVGVHEVYGSTEGGIVTDLRPADARRKPGSVGHAWFMNEVRLVGPDGEPVPPGTPGELYSRSPMLMSGYLRDEAATEECTTPDGFLSAGDIAVADDEGYVTIVDRAKDMIISGGVNIYPREVENALLTHPDVRDAAVVGRPDETWGERVSAFVVLTRPTDVGVLETHARARLAGFKVPREWHVREELPRNAAGKLLKRELRQELR
ncbi:MULTISPECIES: class I adenylate-forming enzyme family protein [unclassified Geodermatophilus]